MALGTIAYGAVATDWETCRNACAQDAQCKQVVFHKSGKNCWGMSEAQDEDQDGLGGSNTNWISAQCHGT